MLPARLATTPDPATDFASDDLAPPDLSLLRQHDYGRSLMDRAQRQRETKTEFSARAQALLEQAATSTLTQEAQLAALDRQAQHLADAERTQSGHRRLRERYDPAELDRSLQALSAIADPAQQRASLTQLQASYAGFAFNPELARRIDAQFAQFEPVVQRREQARLRAAIGAGRYAPSLSDAHQLYPGRRIHTLYDPASRAAVFIPENFADPHLEAEAVQVIQNAFHLAQVTGNRAHLEAALDDPAVRVVSRIPGNRASLVFSQQLGALLSPPRQPSSPTVGAQPSPGVAINPTQAPVGSVSGAGSNPPVPAPATATEETVRAYIWDRKGGSPGHVMITDAKGRRSWLSQFPHQADGKIELGAGNDNHRLSPRATFREEGRAPDGIYEITLPDSAAFRAKVADHAVTRSSWDSFPRDSTDETHCAYCSYEALTAGGLPLPANSDTLLLPGKINDYLRNLAHDPRPMDGTRASVQEVTSSAAPEIELDTRETRALPSAALVLGDELKETGVLHEEYQRRLRELKAKHLRGPEAARARDALEFEFRQRQTALGKAIIKEIVNERQLAEAGGRAALHPEQGSFHPERAPHPNRAAQMMKQGGRLLKIAGPAGEIYTIMTTPKQEREAEIARAGGRMAGAAAGGKAGTALGGAWGGPPGAITGLVLGGMGGAMLGEEVVDTIINSAPTHPPKPHPRLK